jgi:8-oxo-dGTP diphosphatase
MQEKTIRVVSAVIRDNEKYLLTQRRATASLPLLWEFPGGRVEAGETDAGALSREVRGRLGIEITVGKPVAFRRHEYEGYSVELVLYEAELRDGDLEALEINDYRWVAVEDFSNYAFPPADQQAFDDFQIFAGRGKPRKPPQA